MMKDKFVDLVKKYPSLKKFIKLRNDERMNHLIEKLRTHVRSMTEKNKKLTNDTSKPCEPILSEKNSLNSNVSNENHQILNPIKSNSANEK